MKETAAAKSSKRQRKAAATREVYRHPRGPRQRLEAAAAKAFASKTLGVVSSKRFKKK